MIGVNAVPPIPPRLEMVKLPPCMSAAPSLPSRALAASSPVSRAIWARLSGQHFFSTGTTSPFGVSAAKTDVVILVSAQTVAIKRARALKLGELLQRRHAGLGLRNASGVSFPRPPRSPALRPFCLRKASISVISASSNWGDVRNHRPVARQIGAGQFLDAAARLAFNQAELAEVEFCGHGSRSKSGAIWDCPAGRLESRPARL